MVGWQEEAVEVEEAAGCGKGKKMRPMSLSSRVRSFIENKTNGKAVTCASSANDSDINSNNDRHHQLLLLTHLTYFGYVFNPVSFYYSICDVDEGESKSVDDNNAVLTSKPKERFVEAIVAEVSNTPWIEQHSYMLHESVGGVDFTRNKNNNNSKGEGKGNSQSSAISNEITASWDKEFHVSPFMAMDYRYTFTFSDLLLADDDAASEVGVDQDENERRRMGSNSAPLWIKAVMIKKSTNETWFTVNLQMHQNDFSPLMLLYVLVFYPLHTRMIQLWIHWEALLLYLKSVPVFAHPNNPDVNFGLGVTDKTLLKGFDSITSLFSTSSSPTPKTALK